ncbi:MAG: hypothetical protein BM555_05740 [Crocinitomix sp. MedPE-SWsnd]|nr:MAG: hypothetical protein BM555_05740 [Crocinitomix sp. MedPE-SWsnd]
MKIITTAILSLLIGSAAFAGNGNEGINPTKKILQKWQKEFVLYPKQSLKENKKGIVYVSFTLSENGLMNDIQVEEGISPDLDSKAIQIAKNMPKDHLLDENFEADKRFMLPVKFSIK